MLHGLCVGEEVGARNLVFFRVKWLQPAMKATSSVRRLRLGSFCARIVPPMCFATSGCSCVRSCMRFLKLWCQIALELLHDVAWAVCWGGSWSTKPCVFPCKMAAAGDENYLVCAAVAAGVVLCANCSSYVFCNKWLFLCAYFYAFLEAVVPDRIGMAASRLLDAAAACVILLSFAAEDCKSYWSGCIQAARLICQQIFAILALVIFLLKFLLKSASKSSFFSFGVEILFWSCAVSEAVARSSIVFCNSVAADRIGMAASRLLGAAAACVILLSFAAERRKSYWSGCIQAAIVICQQNFVILALVIFLLKFLLKSASKSSFFCFGVEIPVSELQFPTRLRVVLLCFATQSLQIAL